jgi:hypothetical protein
MSIDVRLTTTNPPTPEPKRSVYRDIVDMPSTLKLSPTVRIFNQDSITLYFKVEGTGGNYTFPTSPVELGAIGSGTDQWFNLEDFAERARPVGETDDYMGIVVKAYSDAGYTTLVHTFTKQVHVVYIDSSDVKYTVTEWNFDDGTVQGWTNAGGPGSVDVGTDYALSPPYSLRANVSWGPGANNVENKFGRSLVIGAGTAAYLILNMRWPSASGLLHGIKISLDGVLIAQLGRYGPIGAIAIIPSNKWYRTIIPVTPGATQTLLVELSFWNTPPTQRMNIDDVKLLVV